MQNRTTHFPRGNGTPGVGAFAITPDDGDDLPFVTRAVYIGGEGDLAVKPVDGDPVTFVGLSAGTVLPVQITRVYATGTTATNLIGLD